MYCEKCGNLMSANMRFCPKCGAPAKRMGMGGYGGTGGNRGTGGNGGAGGIGGAGISGLAEGFKKALNFIFDKDDSDMLDEQDKKLIGLAMKVVRITAILCGVLLVSMLVLRIVDTAMRKTAGNGGKEVVSREVQPDSTLPSIPEIDVDKIIEEVFENSDLEEILNPIFRTVPFDSEDVIGKDYHIVEEELRDAGFLNFEYEAYNDLSSNEYYDEDCLEKISIGGKDCFSEGDKFNVGSKVTLGYHSIKKLLAPVASEDIKDIQPQDVAVLFEVAGFTNITLDTVYDLDPDGSTDYECEVIADGITGFNTDTEIAYDGEIVVIGHYPYEKHVVNITIDFVNNLFFNRYDVNVLLDDVKKQTLRHGESKTIELSVADGAHEIRFEKKDSDSVYGYETLPVDSDVDVAYKITCLFDEITVETIYEDHHQDIPEGKIKIPETKSFYLRKDYREVAGLFEEMGFVNIKTEPIYNVYRESGDIDNVCEISIGDEDEFSRGSIFDETAQVVITYRRWYDEDPDYVDKNKGNTEPEENEGVFEYACIREGSEYDIYYLFDVDDHRVVTFSTQDTKALEGTFSGLPVEFIITFGDGYKEVAMFLGKNVLLMDSFGIPWNYKQVDVQKAEAVFNKNIKSTYTVE